VENRELLSGFTDRSLERLTNAVGFALSIVACGEYYPDSSQKIALRLGLPADRVLAAVQRPVIQIEQT
jgi:hypothetical protein